MSIFHQRPSAPKDTHPQLGEQEEEEEYGEGQSLQVHISSKNNRDEEFREGNFQLMQRTRDNKSQQQQPSPEGALLRLGNPLEESDSKESYQSSSHSQQKQTPIKASQGYTSEDDTLLKFSTSKELSLKDEYLPNAAKAKHLPQQQLSSRAKGNPQEHGSYDTLHLLPSGRVHSSPKDNSPQRRYDSSKPSKSQTSPASASPKINQHSNQSFYPNQQQSPVTRPASPPPQRFLSGNDSIASSQNYSSKSKTSPVSASPKNNQQGNQSFYPNQQPSPVTPPATPPPQRYLSGDDSTSSSQNYSSKSKTSPVSASPKNNQHGNQSFYPNQQPSPVTPPPATPPPQRYLSGDDSNSSSQNYSSKSKTSPVSASPKNNQHSNQSFYPNQQQSPVTPSASPPPETFLSGDDSTASSQNYASKSKTSPVSAPPKNNHSQHGDQIPYSNQQPSTVTNPPASLQQKFLSGNDYIASSQNSECNQMNDYDTHRSKLPSVKDSTAQGYRAPSKSKEHGNGSQKSGATRKDENSTEIATTLSIQSSPKNTALPRTHNEESSCWDWYSAPKDAHRRLGEKEEEEEEYGENHSLQMHMGSENDQDEEYGENHSLQTHMGSETDQDDEFGEEQSQLMQMRSDNKSWQQQLSPKGALLQQGYPLNDSDSKEPYQSSSHSQQKQTPVTSSQGYTPQVDTPLEISTSKEFSLKGDYLPNATKSNYSPQQQLLSGAKGKHPKDNTFDPQHLLPSGTVHSPPKENSPQWHYDSFYTSTNQTSPVSASPKSDQHSNQSSYPNQQPSPVTPPASPLQRFLSGDDSTASSQNYPSISRTYPVSAPPTNDHPQHSNQTPYPNQQPSPVTPPPASIPQRFLSGDDSTTRSQNSRRNQTIYYDTHTSKSPSVKDPYEQGHQAPSKSEEHENANHKNVATMKEEGLTGNAATTTVESSPKNIPLPRVHSKEPSWCPCSIQ
ncbi:hypothetical protein COLO4_37770 [Corchorus olitorius]|uniref:Uncharacterized protein n=1 Tax=Corchorus olitorius TaxID=93759 RepID=A0A1R3FZK4_9ROSI|nr:hypothetical protein COLO4_37770 [Corchorus olitorius]